MPEQRATAASDLPAAVFSVLAPHGRDAAEIAALAWVLFMGAAVVFLLVLGCVAVAMYGPSACRARLSRRGAIVGWGIAFPAAALTALLVYTLMASASIKAADPPPRLRIEVIGEQWWWRVHYLLEDGSTDFAAANEIRVPVGVPVELLLRSADVIHSFWVPALAGKMDMIPGRVNRLRITATQAGVFRGQCAEYCGGPHARMALLVVAEEPQRFDSWLQRQRSPAVAAGDRETQHGLALFIDGGCGVCHAVRGTPAAGNRGPDLTHLASRLSIGAATRPNTAAALAGWIADSHRDKPGNLMPRMNVYTGAELSRVVAYLQTLQ